VQGHQPPDQAVQSHIQPGLECLQGWGIHKTVHLEYNCVVASIYCRKAVMEMFGADVWNDSERYRGFTGASKA